MRECTVVQTEGLLNIISDHVSPVIENGFAVISTQQTGTECVAYSRLIP